MHKYQTGLRRFIALFIDGLVVMPLDLLNEYVWDAKPGVSGFIIWATFYSLLAVAYYVYMHAKYGQTIGKWACKVKVLDNDSETAISVKQAVLRDIVPVLLMPYSIYIYTQGYSEWLQGNTLQQSTLDILIVFSLALWGLLEIVTMLTNKKRRAVHDFIAGTVVVSVAGSSFDRDVASNAPPG